MADGQMSSDQSGSTPANVSGNERKASLALAGILAVMGVRRLSLGGLLLVGAGAALAFRGSTGYCPLYDALDIKTDKAA